MTTIKKVVGRLCTAGWLCFSMLANVQAAEQEIDVQLPDRFFQGEQGRLSKPVFAGEKIYYVGESRAVHAVGLDGAVAWYYPLASPSRVSPLAVDNKGKVAFLVEEAGVVSLLMLGSDGIPKWQIALHGNFSGRLHVPIIKAESVLILDSSGKLNKVQKPAQEFVPHSDSRYYYSSLSQAGSATVAGMVIAGQRLKVVRRQAAAPDRVVAPCQDVNPENVEQPGLALTPPSGVDVER